MSSHCFCLQAKNKQVLVEHQWIVVLSSMMSNSIITRIFSQKWNKTIGGPLASLNHNDLWLTVLTLFTFEKIKKTFQRAINPFNFSPDFICAVFVYNFSVFGFVIFLTFLKFFPVEWQNWFFLWVFKLLSKLSCWVLKRAVEIRVV